MSLDNEILKDFLVESKKLVQEAHDLLESVEGDMTQVQRLQDYGNAIDRIMGGAKSIAILAPPDHSLHLISDYSALCKAVGYKTSQIIENENFYNTCVALLLDATETLQGLLDNTDKSSTDLKKMFESTFIDRVRWVSEKFSSDFNASVDAKGSAGKKLAQSEIDDLMKKLGF